MNIALIFIVLMAGWALFALWLWRKPKSISTAPAEAPRHVMATDYALPAEPLPQTRDTDVAYVSRAPLTSEEATPAEHSAEPSLSDEESKAELWEDPTGGRKTDFIIEENLLLNPVVL